MMQRLRLQHRLPLFVSVLLVVLLCAGAFLSYREVRTSAISSAIDRMDAVALQVVSMLTETWTQRALLLSEVTEDPLFLALDREAIDPSDPAVQTLLNRLRMPGETAVVVAFVREEGVTEARMGSGFRDVPPPTWDQLALEANNLHVGPFFVREDETSHETFYWVSIPVTLGGEEIYVAQLRRLAGTSQQLFQDLLSEEASLFFHRQGSNEWIEVGSSAIAPMAPVHADGNRFDYERDGEHRIAIAHTVPGTELRLISEQPLGAVLRSANVFAWRFGLFGFAFIGIGVAVTVAYTRQLLRPVTELGSAARDIADGEYARRVRVDREDEIGEVAKAFNQMASDIERTISDAQYSQAAALRANRAKSTFLANMSHEIRTPINAIVGYAELLKEGISGELSPGQWRYVDRIVRTSSHLTRLVEEVLDTAKIESGELRISTESFPAPWAVRAAVMVIAPQARQGEITLTADCDEVLFRGDPQRVEQILVNLLSNAVKFTGPGGKVTLKGYAMGEGGGPGAIPGPAGGGFCCFEVTDTGCGIGPELQEQIFRPFVQLDEGYTRSTTGAGLGLSISRHLARLMGGDITVKSRVGVGSTFLVKLPAASSLSQHVEGEQMNAYH